MPRESQIQLAQEIGQAIKACDNYAAEAPTGIGKTFAYLVPAILSEKKIVISTGTKNLQDQLFFKDLPKVLKALKRPISVALLKGRQNYVCHYRIAYNLSSAFFQSKSVQTDLLKINNALPRFDTGDKTELTSVAEDSQAWQLATSTADNCLSKDCEYFKECFVKKARAKAQKADLVVINHHLFFADCALKDEGFGEILPDADVIIFDEAHQLPAVARNFFGDRFSTRQLKNILLELSDLAAEHAADDKTLLDLIVELDQSNQNFREIFEENNGRYAWAKLKEINKISLYLSDFVEQLKKCSLYLQEIAERDDNFQLLSERLSQYQLFLSDLAGSQQNLVNAIYWLELFKSSLVINRTPLSVASSFQSVLLPKSAYIYTSATLATSLGFQHFTEQLGLQQIKTNTFDSPFDYGQQTLLYLPRGMPDPNADDYIEQLTEKALPLIQAYQGRTFYLFTSFRALHKAEEILRQHTELSLFVQGEMGKSELVQAFINSHQGVLLGTSSFWEGVDVKGDALSCVIIDKLPFESPFDPVVEARLKQLKQQGVDPFNYHQLPLAIIALKQGLGRLIRSQVDKGVLMIGDPRLSARKYGEAFIESLPAMPISRDLQVVLEFIKSCE